METILEVCAGSYPDCLEAQKGGAHRVELNSALELGGLTPTGACLSLVKNITDLEVICMVRPRADGFLYTPDEYEQMKAEARDLLEKGADGLAFGFLKEDLTVDPVRTGEFVQLCHTYGKTAVFHRAFDICPDQEETIQTLIDLGVDRILTSGGMPTAPEGKEQIRKFQQTYGDQIQILAGSGVNPSNVRELVDFCNLNQVHSSCKSRKVDPTSKGNSVSFQMDDLGYGVVSSEVVANMIQKLDKDAID